MVVLKPVNNSDALLLFLLEQENYWRHCYKYRNLIQMINNTNYLVYKLIVKNNLYGYFILMHSGDDFELIRLTVKKRYHHQGYGRQMLKYILTHFSYQQIFLEVNEHNLAAQQLYLKHGFKIIPTISQYYDVENGYLIFNFTV
ncbi:GNAT family N-acetyltransferase [Spiroplasma citri]|uniref:GNAT family N-acetyltransferase n=1 Tax=Spiroplasma citri TaxID=2133 RepID=A0AAX3SWS5_SPICI|nr:GNAT family N-acetyltransferase [Spiroplasma citri]WFG95773.1 GNAT family N-acetyltransferase [Spiroplasma citri]WFG99655.1 GNAT family N-acetyltransferase [Spiroplasma citri]